MDSKKYNEYNIIENKPPPANEEYLTDNAGETFNKNYSKILKCLYCMKIPLIEANEINITANCVNNHKQILSYQDFRPIYLEKWKKILICTICSKTFLEDSFFFCQNCEKYYCNKDKNEHLLNEKCKEHKIKYIRKMESICSEHNDKIYSYCNECNKDICVLCTGHEKHNQTYINSIIIKEDELHKYKEQYKNIKLYVEKTYEKIEQIFIQMKETYESIKSRNIYQIDLAEYLLGCYLVKYEERDLTYNIINNITHFYKVLRNNIIKIFNELSKIKWPFEDENLIEKNLSKLNIFKELKEHTNWVNCLIPLDNGDFVSSSSDSKIIIYDLNNLSPKNIIDESENGVNYIYKINNNKIISCTNVHTMKIFRFFENNNKYIIEQILYGHQDNIKKIIQNSFDNSLISCSEDKSIKIWSINNNNYIFNKELIINENIDSIVQSRNNEIISTSSSDFTVKFWDLKSFKNLSTISEIKCSPYPNSLSKLSNEYIGIGGWDNNGIYLINIDTRSIVKQIEIGYNINVIYNNDFDIFYTCEYKQDNEMKYYYEIGQWKMDNSYNKIKCISKKYHIHNNLITSILKINKEKEMNTIYLTSSYDKTIKVWK